MKVDYNCTTIAEMYYMTIDTYTFNLKRIAKIVFIPSVTIDILSKTIKPFINFLTAINYSLMLSDKAAR